MNRRTFVGALGLGALGWRTGVPSLDGETLVERWSWAMGQPVHLTLFAASDAAGLDAAQRALAELWRVEAALSLFDEASDLSEVNRRAGGHAVRVGTDLTTVLAAGLRFESLTAGAFNPAIEPLMQAWGFHAPRRAEPTASEIAGARDAVAAAKIVVADGRVALPVRDTRLDLGGIGVGYGLDRAIDVLRRGGIRRAFLDVSGDCLPSAPPPESVAGSSAWSIQQ